ncbi:MAG: class I SAM-dependent methyltransferase [Caldilineaceae bacterium]|nr:class I SAM-dependent methyltransferase [Caldilineaceae bacterium]
MPESVACNLCGSDRSRPYGVIPDLLLDRPDVCATLVQCTECGLVYQNPRPTPEEIGAHYPPEYEPYTDITQGKRSWLLQRAINYGIQKRCRFITRHRPPGRLLDIGCAAGTFMLGMAQNGWETVGVELSQNVAALARSRHGLNVYTGTLEQARFEDESFDAVTMWDVLEHVHDPAATLREIRRILRPGGLLLVRVPNLASWDARLFGEYWAGLDAPRHLYVFTPGTLSRLMGRAGFQVIDESTNIGGYPTFALSVRFRMTANRATAEQEYRTTRLLYHPATRLASAPFFLLPSMTGRGPLLVTTARK